MSSTINSNNLKIVSFLLFLISFCMDLSIMFDEEIKMGLTICRLVFDIIAFVTYIKSLLMKDKEK